MARGKKSGGRDFKKGSAPKSPGRPKTPEALKNVQRLNKLSFEEVVNKYLWCDLKHLDALKANKDLPVTDAWVVSIIVKGVTTGDWGSFEWIAQRLIGKVKDQLEVSTIKPFVVENLDGSTMELGVQRLEEGE